MPNCDNCDGYGWVVYESNNEYGKGDPGYIGNDPDMVFEFSRSIFYLEEGIPWPYYREGEATVLCDVCDGFGVVGLDA